MPDIIHKPIASHASSFLEALKTGSTTALLGMVIVFAVLAIIFAALVIMRKALNGLKPDEATDKILDMFSRTRNNREFVSLVKKNRFI